MSCRKGDIFRSAQKLYPVVTVKPIASRYPNRPAMPERAQRFCGPCDRNVEQPTA